jgi:hypothetical protein
MTSTYNPALTTNKDWVRYHLGDRDDPFMFSNEEIAAQLALNSDSAIDTAIEMCTAVVAMYARKASSPSVGPFSIDYGQTADQYRQLLRDLKNQRSGAASPYLSGYEAAQEQDGDAKEYMFDTYKDDNLYSETYEGVRSPTGWPQ